MKTLLAVAVGIAIAIFALFHFAPWSRDYADQSRTKVDNGFRDRVEDQQVIDKATNEIATAETYLRAQYAKVYEGKEKTAGLDDNLKTQNRQLADAESIIKQATAWLDSHKPGDTLSVGGQTFGYAAVVADAKSRAQNCENLRINITSLEQSRQEMSDATTDGDNNIKEAIRQLNKKKGELATKAVQLAVMRTRQETRALVDSISTAGSPAEINTRYFKEVDRRITSMKADTSFDNLAGAHGAGKVAWEKSTDNPGDLDYVRQYGQKYLGATPTATPTPTVSSANPAEIPFSAVPSPTANPEK